MSYYVTKSNPNIWRLKDYLATSPTLGWWSVVCKDARPGDTLFIGQSGEEAGIFAVATIASRSYFDTLDPEFLVDPKEAKKRRLGADIVSFQVLSRPILQPELRIPELERVARWLRLQGSRRHLTEEEAEALNRLISP